MADFTKNLNLLKKDPITDGADTFNIKTMLNENWDKIDTAVGELDAATPKLDTAGKISAAQMPDSVQNHLEDTTKHITAAERTAWNEKASTEFVQGQVDDVKTGNFLNQNIGFYLNDSRLWLCAWGDPTISTTLALDSIYKNTTARLQLDNWKGQGYFHLYYSIDSGQTWNHTGEFLHTGNLQTHLSTLGGIKILDDHCALLAYNDDNGTGAILETTRGETRARFQLTNLANKSADLHLYYKNNENESWNDIGTIVHSGNLQQLIDNMGDIYFNRHFGRLYAWNDGTTTYTYLDAVSNAGVCRLQLDNYADGKTKLHLYRTPDNISWTHVGEVLHTGNIADVAAIKATCLSTPVWKKIQSYTTAGTYTWTAPDINNGKNYVVGAFIIGGGGSGGVCRQQSSSGNAYSLAASGGAAGFTKIAELTVSPQKNYAVVVGKGGASQTLSTNNYANGNAGGSSAFAGYTANGGAGGTYSTGITDIAKGAVGGQCSDDSRCRTKFAGNAHAGGVMHSPMTSASSGFALQTQTGRYGYNPYEPQVTYLSAGGGASADGYFPTEFTYTQSTTAVSYGAGGSGAAKAAKDTTTLKAVASNASGYGNGGGAAVTTNCTSTAVTSSATSGAGSAGAVFLYVRTV